MRSIIVLFIFGPLLLIGQQDSVAPARSIIHGYMLPGNQPCIGYSLKETRSVDQIAKMFHTSAGAIYRANKLLSYRAPQQGDLLNVPVDMKEILGLFGYNEQHIPVVYTVKKGETLFRIARRHFDLPVDILMQLNHLESPDLSVGQSILLGYVELSPSTPPLDSLQISAALPEEVSDPFVEEIALIDKGVALWNREHPEFQHLFAMHRTARINSMIEITNPMFDRTILVKVVGKIPRTFSDDITIVVSPGVARKLGAIDSRFYVQLRYVK